MHYTPCSCKYAVNETGVKPKSRSTLCKSVMLSKVKRVIAAFVSGGFGSTASITAAPTPTRGVGAGALMLAIPASAVALAAGQANALSAPTEITLDLSELDFLDSESATVLARLKQQHGVTLDGVHLFVQQVIDQTEQG